MKEQANSQYLKEIIARYLAGTATAAELEFLEQRDMLIDKDGGDFSKINGPEKQDIKDQIKQRLDLEIRRSRPSIRFVRWARYAAAALLFATVGTEIYYYSQSNSTQVNEELKAEANIASSATISPGTNRATIVLDDGSEYQLSESQSGIVNAVNAITYEDGNPISTSAYTSATIVVPAAGQYRVTLSDGTKVWLNSISSLRYPVQFSGSERRVALSGEAYFEVHKDASRPFIVESDGQEVKVLGTKFNVSAYQTFPLITTLLEGAVEVSADAAVQKLTPGQQVRVSDGKMKLMKGKVDLEEVTAWKNGYFKFSGNLESIMDKVARWYDIEVIYKVKPDPNMTFEGKISRDKNIEEIFEIMELTKEIHFEVQGRSVIVMK
ncbi:FecR family protein [Sphingobacterium faecale]|uniref:FecR domain-containing protein n=1 Tax=Sphingobacterium faecale TaxID=2803775 RepID=A0ABS1R5E5_9SPHI|nr:FecR family protein [Sphingobacterium faecale]MBL1409464.1 FecR domain-containing protein [Sphingobacterium faecale]